MSEEIKTEEVMLPSEELEKPEVTEIKTPDTSVASEEKPETEESKPEEEVTESKADFSVYQKELAETGDLTPESIKKITEQHNLSEEVVKEYVELIKGQREAKVKEVISRLHTVAGSEEAYKEMCVWGEKNLTKAERDAFNKQLDSGMEAAEMAVAWLKQKSGIGASKAELILGKPKAPVAKGYTTKDAWIKDLADRRYSFDKEYRAKVEAKFAATDMTLLK